MLRAEAGTGRAVFLRTAFSALGALPLLRSGQVFFNEGFRHNRVASVAALRPGMPFALLPESAFAFAGILTWPDTARSRYPRAPVDPSFPRHTEKLSQPHQPFVGKLNLTEVRDNQSSVPLRIRLLLM